MFSDNIFDEIDADLNHLNQIYPELNHSTSSEYYNATKFQSNVKYSNCDFSLIHYNIRSLYPKLDEVLAELNALNYEFSIICFTESWLNKDLQHLATITDYNSYHSLRNDGRRGGGISAFISQQYSVKILQDLTYVHLHIETLFLELFKGGKTVLCGIVYRPPDGADNLFFESLNQILSSINRQQYKEIILCGDYNYDLLNYHNNPSVQTFLDTANSYAFFPLISKPTRITTDNATLIDNIFVTTPVQITAGSLISSLSDHLPVFLIHRHIFTGREQVAPEVITFRLVNNRTLSQIHTALSQHDFSDIVGCGDVTEAVARLDCVLYEYYNQYCPLITKTISPKDKQKPWITRDIVNEIKRRQNLQVIYKMGKISEATFKRFRNYVTAKIRTSKSNYFRAKFGDYKNNIKVTWKIINSIIRPNSKQKKEQIQSLIVNNNTITENRNIADALNNFFVNVGINITKHLNRQNTDHIQYLTGSFDNPFSFRPVTTTDIEKVILSLKNKSSDTKTVPAKILKHLHVIIAPVLKSIINKSFESALFPDNLKIAKVVPIFKDGQKTNCSNYRPISILPVISKIFEKCAHKQLYDFFQLHNILVREQYGFRSGKSTTNAIVNFLNYLYQHLDKRYHIFSIFLDFSKAFDCVNHTILISKLRHYGVRGLALEWIISYLTNRQQYVVVGDAASSMVPIKTGVPQGSILGPLLFLIYINDLAKVTNFFKFILYADDSTLSCKFTPDALPNIHNEINNKLEIVSNWLTANKLSVNISKTKYILFSYKNKIEIPTIKIGQGTINSIDHIKFLGVYIDQHLNFNQHVNYLTNKISKSIGILHKVKYILPRDVLRALYIALIQPYFIYGIEAWFGATKTTINKLQILQKSCIRAINNLKYYDHTSHFFRLNKILKLEDLNKQQIAIYLYKTLNTDYDTNLSESLTTHREIHTHSTRHNTALVVPRLSRVKSQSCIEFRGTKIWNELPSHIRDLPSRTAFSIKTRQFFLDRYGD